MSTEPDATPVAPDPVNPESVDPAPDTAAADAAPPRPRGHLVLAAVLLALGTVGLDQLTKWWAMRELVVGEPQRQVIGDFITLRLVMNPGAALGLGTGYTWVLTIVVLVVIAVIIRVMSKIRSRAWALTLGLLLGGAVGNLVDRLFRYPGFARGHVVDFIGYHTWFTGNVADIAIVVAAVMLALLSLVGVGLDGTRDGDRKAPPAPAADAEGEPDAEAGA